MSRCSRCTFNLPSSARYCPRCGAAHPGSPPGTPLHDARAGIPWAGIAFVLGILFAPAAVISGFWWGSPTLIWTGVVAAAAIILVVVLAHF